MRLLKLGSALVCFLILQIEAIENNEEVEVCLEDSLPCDSGQCVRRDEWCDGQKNCEDESDEAYCKRRNWFKGDPNDCEETHFLCNDGRCVPLVAKCDGHADCSDKSDETNCEPYTYDDYDDYFDAKTTTETQTEATTTEAYSEGNGFEYDDLHVTTTTTQTPTYAFTEHENGQTGSHTSVEEARDCPEDSLPCDSGHCVRREEWCDGQKNCEDESDEAYCKKITWFLSDPNHCERTHFMCSDGRCVPHVARCDGFSDCWGGSDEYNCEPDTFDDYDDYPDTKTTTEIQTEATTTEAYSESNGLDYDDLHFTTTTTQAPTQVFTQYSPFSWSTVNFYTKSMGQENGQTGLQPHTSVPFHQSPTIPETAPAPEKHTIRQVITTSRPLPPTASTTRPSEPRRYYDSSPKPILFSPPTRYDSRRRPDLSLTAAVHPPRSYDYGHYNSQSHTPSYQSTRSYVSGQYPDFPQTRSTRAYDSKLIPNQIHTHPPRSYETRRTHPYQYQTQPTRPYDSRRDSNQYHSQPTRPYDSGRDNNQYHTQPTKPYESRGPPSVPTRPPQYPYIATLNQNSQNPYGAIIQRFHLDREHYYDGYYNQKGKFVVLLTSQRHQNYTDTSPDTAETNGQDSDFPTSMPFKRQLKASSRFYFVKNYSRILGDGNISYLRKGREWILSVRNSEGGWGKDTPRALIALSLINNSFVNGTHENDMMQKYFQVYLGTTLMRKEAESTHVNRLAMYVHALMATCQNPRDFYGTDLTDLIQQLVERRNRHQRHRTESVNPNVYLSLCLADRDLTQFEENDLVTRLSAYTTSTPDEHGRDMLSLSISAFSCHLQRQTSMDPDYQRSMHSVLSNATTKLLERMKHDGSFGSVYSTALAAQALLSLNNTKYWNPETTFDFLKQHQKSDGSFGDFLATYLALPVLSGRSLLHLRNTQCTPPKSDRDLTPSEITEYRSRKQLVRYSMYIGYPKVNGYSIEVLVPRGTSFFDIMRVAEHKNELFKFAYEKRNGDIYVYSISNVPNDSEKGFEWNLYAKRTSDIEVNKLNSRERILTDIREFYPKLDQHVIFWYHPIACKCTTHV